MLEKEVFRACGLDDVYPALHPQLIDVAGVARQLAASGAAYDGNRYLDRLAEDDVDPGILSRSIILTAPSDFELKIGLALMRQRMQRSHTLVAISVQEELNPKRATCIDFILLIAEKLLALGTEYRVKLDQPHLPASPDAYVNILAIPGQHAPAQHQRLAPTLEVDVEPSLLESLSSTRLSAKYSVPLHDMVQQSFEHKFNQLVTFCNMLIGKIEAASPAHLPAKLALVLEGLYLMPRDALHALLIPHAPLLASLGCNVIYPVPCALFHHPHFCLVAPCFGSLWEVPEMRLYDAEGRLLQHGIMALREIVLAHVASDLFHPPLLLNQLVLQSGGHLSDLFFLVVSAADKALDRNSAAIEACDCEKAIAARKKAYTGMIAMLKDGQGQPIPTQAVERLLTEVGICVPARVIAESELARHLLQEQGILCVGEGDYRVHPMLREVLGLVDRDVGIGRLNQDPHQSAPATSY